MKVEHSSVELEMNELLKIYKSFDEQGKAFIKGTILGYKTGSSGAPTLGSTGNAAGESEKGGQ